MNVRFGGTLMETQAEVAAEAFSVAAGNSEEPVRPGLTHYSPLTRPSSSRTVRTRAAPAPSRPTSS